MSIDHVIELVCICHVRVAGVFPVFLIWKYKLCVALSVPLKRGKSKLERTVVPAWLRTVISPVVWTPPVMVKSLVRVHAAKVMFVAMRTIARESRAACFLLSSVFLICFVSFQALLEGVFHFW